jgi:hypothetical protein
MKNHLPVPPGPIRIYSICDSDIINDQSGHPSLPVHYLPIHSNTLYLLNFLRLRVLIIPVHVPHSQYIEIGIFLKAAFATLLLQSGNVRGVKNYCNTAIIVLG